MSEGRIGEAKAPPCYPAVTEYFPGNIPQCPRRCSS